jgi:proteic killer suppression protein
LIRSFRDRETKDIFEGRDTKRARRRLPLPLRAKARRRLDRLDEIISLRELGAPTNRLEKLSGDREEQYSIRINRQYRICFRWVDTDAWDVEITDYH